MITIPLSKQGKNAGKYEAIVDDCDADLAELRWFCSIRPCSIYARRKYKERGISESLHRVILSRKLRRPLSNDEQVDHINHNGLDNRRDNLRVASPSQNAMNRNKPSTNKSGLKGASWDKINRKWLAQIRIDGKQLYIGRYDTPEQAHEAYCAATKEHFGNFANNG